MQEIYEPREDSFFFLEVLKKQRFRKNIKALDVGTGSGILAEELGKLINGKVYATDISKDSIKHAKTNIMRPYFIVSDLLSALKTEFDLIIFNPPYLPKKEQYDQHLSTNKTRDAEMSRLSFAKLRETSLRQLTNKTVSRRRRSRAQVTDKTVNRRHDNALDGGEHGYEVVEKFINQLPAHLNKNGQCLLLISSLTNPKKVEEFIKNAELKFKILAQKKLFFEKLFIYLIEK